MAPKLYLMYPSPPCRAVLMVAKMIGLELELEEVHKDQLRTPEMLEINPQHTAPILVDDDFIVWDSHAIAGYLVGKYGQDDSLYPREDIEKRAIIDQRLHFDTGILFERGKAAMAPLFSGTGEIPEEAKDNLIEAYGFLEAFLRDKLWLAGDDITIADLSILATTSSAELLVPIEEDRFPKLTEWLQRAKDLPFYDECNAAGLEKFKEFVGLA